MQNEFDNVMNSLNEQQLEAVSQLDGPVLVLAGAGTGKTKVLTARMAKLIIEEKAQPDEILCVTFTRKAAKEMRERIYNLIGEPAEDIWLGTIDSVAYRILHYHAELAGLEPNFSVVNNNSDNNGHIIKEDYREEEIDVNNLLPRNLELFAKNNTILGIYQNQFKYILVDEYQDTNAKQYTWLDCLLGGKEQKNIFCVGDDDQSIYGFRGAKIQNILNFQKKFNDVSLIRLEENYRSTRNIVNTASSLISFNSQRLGKELQTRNELGEPVAVTKYSDSMDEAIDIAEKIETIVAKGGTLSEIAILVRSYLVMHEIKLQLKEREIAFEQKKIENNNIEDDDCEYECEGQSAVSLMTLHAAKGLEFDYVFLPCWEENSFPHFHSTEKERKTNNGVICEAIEEERRLAYVGITRARKRVYISHADSRTIYKGTPFTVSKDASRFLKELSNNDLSKGVANIKKDDNLSINTRLHSVPVIITSEVNTPSMEKLASEESVNKKLNSFDKGDKCHHSKYGEGVIVEVNDSIVHVEFVDGIQKWIAASYLELIDAVE